MSSQLMSVLRTIRVGTAAGRVVVVGPRTVVGGELEPPHAPMASAVAASSAQELLPARRAVRRSAPIDDMVPNGPASSQGRKSPIVAFVVERSYDEGGGRRPWPSPSTPPRGRSGRGSSRWDGTAAAGTPGTSWTTPGRRSAQEIHPEWQDLAVGDQLKSSVFGRVLDAYRVLVVEPNTFLCLYGYSDLRGRWLDPTEPRPRSYMEALWGFLLNELPDGRTRLVISGYQTFRPRWVERFVASWLLILMSWPMQSRMLAVLKRNIERAAGKPPVPRSSTMAA